MLRSRNARPIDGSFTAMSDCLPATDIAISMMEAVASPETLRRSRGGHRGRMRAINETSPSAWVCVREAISDAVDLRALVGSPDKIEDPRFHGISDPEDFARLEDRLASRISPVPRFLWGFHHLSTTEMMKAGLTWEQVNAAHCGLRLYSVLRP